MWQEYFKQYSQKGLRSWLNRQKWNYKDDICVLGYYDMYKATGDREYVDYIINILAPYLMSEDGTVINLHPDESNIDRISFGKSLTILRDLTGDVRYKRAVEQVYSMLEKYPRLSLGNFWHKNIYPNQLWGDGLYMGQPFYARYIADYAMDEKWNDVINQFLTCDALLWDEELGLYKHGYDESRKMEWSDSETGRSPSVWLRAEGWYLMALCDVYEIAKGRSVRAGELKGILKKALDRLMPYQDEDSKMFLNVVDRKDFIGNYLETSGSAMVAYALMKGARLGMLPEEYWHSGSEIIDGIRKKYLVKNEDGEYHLKGICASAGLGPGPNRRPDRDGTVEYYVQREKQMDDNQHGTAACMMAVSEQLLKN